MCGIFGITKFNGEPIQVDAVINARDIITHRGPDDAGLFTSADSRTVFAHRRLSIIDLSELGHQPMSTADGRYTIVYNGEIYNFTGLREMLEKNGSRKFRSHCDTEVVLNLYAEYGEGCLNFLRGMFAFAVWDEKEKTLFGARDRFGIKPFYYLHNKNEFIFSSELKAIKFYKDNLTISIKAVDAFLRTGSVPSPLTIYNETVSLEPGSWIKVDHAGRVEKSKWWTFQDLIKNGEGRKVYNAEAKEEIAESLRDTVKAHCIADVEVGAFLSGGIDSTAIVSLMKQTGYHKIKTISITFPGNKLDESYFAKIAADKFKTDHHEYPLTEVEVLNDFDRIIDAMDQPTIDGINTYFVSKAAKDFGLKVVMSGLGGDELFGGYSSFLQIPKYRKIKDIPFSKSLMKLSIPLVKNYLPGKVCEYFSAPDLPNAEYKLMRGLFSRAELKELGLDFDLEHPFDEHYSAKLQKQKVLSSKQLISCLESTLYMQNQLLRDSDIFSMQHALELRVPFVDHKLYETALPYLEDGFNKSWPKKMLCEGTGNIPDDIMFRKKMGFTFPFGEWIQHGELNKRFKELYDDDSRHNMFDKKGFAKLTREFEEGKVHWSRLWALGIITSFNS